MFPGGTGYYNVLVKKTSLRVSASSYVLSTAPAIERNIYDRLKDIRLSYRLLKLILSFVQGCMVAMSVTTQSISANQPHGKLE